MRRQLVIAAIATLLGGCGSPTPSGSAGPSGAAEPSVAVPVGWTRTLAPTFDGISTIGRLAAGPGGFVALADFSAWRSPDGLTWTPVKQVGDQPRAILAPVGLGGRWIAGGWVEAPTASGSPAATGSTVSGTPAPPTPMSATCPAGPIAIAQFSSSPDGATWTIGPTDPSFRTYVVGQLAADPGGTGTWAVGANSCAEGLEPRSMSWFSADGLSWSARPTTSVDGLMTGIAAVGDRLVAVGASTDDPGATGAQGLAWTMTPASGTWSAATVIPGAAPLGQAYALDGTAYAIARGVQPTVWSSTDLTTWQATAFPGNGPRMLVAVNGSGGTWLAASASDGIYGLRPDGSWTRLAGATDKIEALTMGPDGLLAIGLSADGHGVIWQGPTSRP
ncbi:MAG TPA: hypothetical protein VGI98_03765 [Candidatus Limnocylindrales bacterium]